jgi:hypothetical protein
MRSRYVLLLCLSLGLCRTSSAQTAATEPSWFEPQTVTLSSRYRLIENSAGDTTANQLQFKDALRARVNIDRDRRFTINIGAFSGSSFTSSWDATGVGSGAASANMYVKQLYGSIAPVRGVELQVGGLYINHGESTEITSYDDDGYVMGERVTIRRPKQAYFDEVSVTRASLSAAAIPGVFRRLKLLNHQNYWQAQVVKRFGAALSASADFTEVAGAETLRAAVAVHLPARAPLSAVRLEQYRRVTMQPATGFALVAERPIVGHARMQGGYADIDLAYGGLNGDRYQQGRRVFAMATIPLMRALSAQIYATHALGSSPVANRTRFDAVVTYDVLAAVRSRHHT